MKDLSEKTADIFKQFAQKTGQGDDGTTTHSLWRDALLSAFDHDEVACDDKVIEILKEGKVTDDQIEDLMGDFHACLWILDAYKKRSLVSQ